MRKIVDKINALEPEYEKLSDEELRGKTGNLRKDWQRGRHLMIF